MTNKLRDLEAIEVSLVPRAANKRKFLLLKSDGGGEGMHDEILKELLITELENENEVEEVLKQQKMTGPAMNAVKGALRLLSGFKDQLPKDIMNTMANLAGYGYAAPKKQEKPKDKDMPMKKEEIDGLEVDDNVKAALTALWKEKESMEEKSKKLEEIVKQHEEEKLTSQFVEIAKEFDKIPGEVEDLGKTLMAISKIDPELEKKVEEVFKAANTVIKENETLTKEIGSSVAFNGNALDKIEAIAKEYEAKGMTHAKAITKAIEENPDLYTAYIEGGSK